MLQIRVIYTLSSRYTYRHKLNPYGTGTCTYAPAYNHTNYLGNHAQASMHQCMAMVMLCKHPACMPPTCVLLLAELQLTSSGGPPGHTSPRCCDAYPKRRWIRFGEHSPTLLTVLADNRPPFFISTFLTAISASTSLSSISHVHGAAFSRPRGLRKIT